MIRCLNAAPLRVVLRRAALAAGALVLGGQAWAATYYVDAKLGNDGFAGTAAVPDAAGSNGPWQSLAKVSAAALLPGDAVLLRCGQQWREPLRLMKGGAAGQPLTIGSYPFGCADKPAIDGGIKVPAEAWDKVSGNIYRATLPLSVLAGGRLAATVAGWRTYSPAGDARLSLAVACPQSDEGCGAMRTVVNGGLAISPPFSLVAGQRYNVSVQVLADVGAVYGATVRRFSNVAMQSSYASGKGNGAWQTLSFSFTAPASVSDARIDIDVPGNGRTTYLRKARVVPDQPVPGVVDMVATGGTLQAAHHPNVGVDAARPGSVYLKAGTSAVVRDGANRTSANYLTTGSDLVLPAGASITAGLTLWTRSQAWSISKQTVTGVSGNRVSFAPNTPYPLSYPGWGYFFTGALWMLDSPGEWFYDSGTATAQVWMPDGAAPGARVTLSTLPLAVQIGDPTTGIFPSNITLENLAIRNAGQGFGLARMSNITLRALDVRDIAGPGVVADGSPFLRVENSQFTNTQSDAINAVTANDATVIGNTIINSGVIADIAGVPQSLPREHYDAILVGARARVAGNRLTNIGYIGILAGSDSVIEDNVVQRFSLVLNDGGGLYGAGSDRLVIRNNMVLDGIGNRDGIPTVLDTLVSSVYLDGNAGSYTVSGNTFANADHCLQMHDAYNSTVENNTCYGARRPSIRIQETNRNRSAQGDVYGNAIRNNRLFQTTSGSSLMLGSKVADVGDFASFDYNSYSTLVTPIISQESSPGVSRSFSLPDWQAAGPATGRVLEPNGRVGAPMARYARGQMGGAVPLQMGALGTTIGWGSLTAGSTMAASASCGPKTVPCITFQAGTSLSTFYVPRFAVTKDRTYRVAFDAAVSDPAQTLQLTVIRGSAPYDSLLGLEPFVFSGSTAWKRYSFTFKAAADATNARMDVNGVLANKAVSFANVEVVELAVTGLQPTSALLINTSDAPAAQACPLAATQPQDCTKFFRFPEGTRVVWPFTLAARSSQIVFTQDDSLADSDGDGIADSQDACPGTPTGATVNARGCALVQ